MVCDHETLLDVIGFRQRGKTGICAGPTKKFILVADDHTIVRQGLTRLLEEQSDIKVVGEATNGREAVEMAGARKPDVVLMDLVMPEMDGIEAIRQIKSQHPEIAILVLTTFAGEDKVFPAIKAGASGYQLKDSDPEELVTAIRQVYRGEPALHPVEGEGARSRPGARLRRGRGPADRGRRPGA